MKSPNPKYDFPLLIAVSIVSLIVAMSISYVGAKAHTPTNIDLSWRGWKDGVERYRETRAPQRPYDLNTLREAANELIEALEDGHRPETVHWAGVRMIAETKVLVREYVRSDIHR